MNISNKLQITILCSLFIVTFACNSISTDNGSSAPSSQPNSTTPLTASADPRADVEKAMRGRLAVKSYRMRKVLTMSSGLTTITSYETVNPDRMHMTTETTLPGKGTGKRETIIIGKEAYRKTGDAQWEKDEYGTADALEKMRDPKLIDAVAQKAEVKYLGTDMLEGAPMMIYQYTIKDLLGPGKDAVSKIWIGATDHLEHQMESESDIESTIKPGQITHTKTTVTYYDYNTDIKIESPM